MYPTQYPPNGLPLWSVPGGTPVHTITPRVMNDQIIQGDIPIPAPNPMRQLMQPVQQPGQQGFAPDPNEQYASMDMAQTLLAMAHSGENIETPMELAGRLAQSWAGSRMEKRAREQEEARQRAKEEQDYQRQMQIYNLTRQHDLEDYEKKAQIGSKYGAGSGEYGLSPVYGTDADGNTVIMQLSKSGNVRRVETPDGVTVSTGVEKIDAGTHYLFQDKRSGQIVGRAEKDVEGEAAAKAAGAAKGEAIGQLPGELQQAEQALLTIEQLRNHPGRQAGTGRDFFRGSIPATDAYDFATMNRQAQGQTFLQAYQSLKGGGQITEVEGMKAEQAIARLDRAQSEEAYLAALKDLEDVIRAGTERARQRAGQAPGQTPAPAPAPSGSTSSGVKWSIEP